MKFAASLIASAAATTELSWEDYKMQFGKVYNGAEESSRKAIYESKMQEYSAHNADASQTFTMGANQFSDLTLDEFKALPIRGYVASAKMGLPNLGVHEYKNEALADTVNWVTKGVVTPVKNQGQCGSCWAFSTTGGTEGSWAIGTGSLVSLSEQQLVDCSKQNSGCNGGLMDYGFAFYEKTNIASESSYPYTAKDGSCKSSYTTAIPQGGVTGYKDVSSSTQALLSAIAQQPVSVAVEADQSAFQGYTGGIISSGCGTSLDHGVLAVGYDTSAGYFLVKNSWGASWGDNGYLKISTSGNVCGIHSQPSYPVVDGAAPPAPPTPPPTPTPPPPPTPPAPTPAPGSAAWHVLQRGFSAVTIGIGFQTDEIGWTSHTDGSSLPKIVKTHDGGATWNEVQNVTGLSVMTMGVAAEKGSAIDVGVTGALESSLWSVDGERFYESLGAPIVSQDIKREGGHFLIAGPKGPCIGSLGGLRYKCTPEVPLENPGTGRYASRPNGGDTIYFAAGTWPSDSTEKVVQVGEEQHHRLTRNVRIIDGKKMEVAPETSNDDPVNDYSAELWKSTDGGATWTQLHSNMGNYYFNDIHCFDETHCVAVAEGFGESGGETGARIFYTKDGETFEQVLHQDEKHTESLMTTRMLSPTEYWVGGAQKPGGLLAPSLILHSIDGGVTHTDESNGVIGQMMTSLDCLSGDHCYATSITALQTCNLLEFGGKNPPAPTPAPSPGSPHYEAPPCQAGEASASVTDTGGSVCAPPCDASGNCPTDVIDGVTAQPSCALKDSSSGAQYCALMCETDDMCDSDGGANCAHPQAGMPGICVYPSQSNGITLFLNAEVSV